MATQAEQDFPDADPQLVYDLARNKHAVQMGQVDALDGKISNILGVGSALLGILAAFLALHEKRPPDASIASLSIAGALYGTLALLSLLAYFPRAWAIGPKLQEAWDYAAKYSLRHMYWWAAEAFKDQTNENHCRLQFKVWATRAGLILLIGEAVALAVGLLLAAAV
jgi:hypothetical protein